ncbi:hypothetical protein [Saccharopolyspora dendranthemae]|uniref:Uncharacterized protein n=1 Tax=Saccharopolyspora dendranthemae TaxID=1181886 RepID=A0A561U127_9PSEU|nr:hypothetical protein [Saccharopolyspora dendranthemae]TWF93072.1 hypothetical protein FHU35_16355 [Saccharopolyspora dendranthemae]
MRLLGDLFTVLIIPLVCMLLGALIFAVVLAQGWGLQTLVQ